MKLNRTGSNWSELELNKINENWERIENLSKTVDNLIIEGGGSDSSSEVIAARGGYPLLGNRLDESDNKLFNNGEEISKLKKEKLNKEEALSMLSQKRDV